MLSVNGQMKETVKVLSKVSTQ